MQSIIIFLKRYNTSLILLSIALTLVFGIWMPEIFEPIRFIGDLFINMLRVFALPLICSALVAAVGQLRGGVTRLKNMTRNVISYVVLSEIMAVSIALVLFNILKPGVGLSPDLILQGKPLPPIEDHGLSVASFITGLFPQNLFESLLRFEVLPLVVFSIFFGLAASMVGENAKPVIKLAIGVRDISMQCLHAVMYLAPLGIFSLVGSGIAQAHAAGNLQANLMALMSFVLVLFLGLAFHALWQAVLVAALNKQKMRDIIVKSTPLFATAFATSSSLSCLPLAMDTASKLRGKQEVIEFMLPLCAAVNIGGMMLYEVSAALFFSQMLGFDLSLGHQIALAATCILGGMAAGGVPEASLVSLVIVFKVVNVPLSAISILLPLDRIIDRIRTMVNIFGNMCGVLVVSYTLRSKSSLPGRDI